jgi:hypothetical protein
MNKVKEKRDNKNCEGEKKRLLIERKGRPTSWFSKRTAFNPFKTNYN